MWTLARNFLHGDGQKVVSFERCSSKIVRHGTASVWSRFGIFAATDVIISGSLGTGGVELGLLLFLLLLLLVVVLLLLLVLIVARCCWF